jgi:hypothetical protein
MTTTDTPRPDSALLDLDVPAALAAGLVGEGTDRRLMYTDAAIAASLHAERLGVGPYPLRFLAGYVRSAGRAAALALPEPLIGAAPTELARGWLAAAVAAADAEPAPEIGGGADVTAELAADDRRAQWLDMVAALIAVRRDGGSQRTADAS